MSTEDPRPKVVRDWYREAMNAEGEVLAAIGRRYQVERYVGMLSRESDLELRTRVMDAIVQARMAEARRTEDIEVTVSE